MKYVGLAMFLGLCYAFPIIILIPFCAFLPLFPLMGIALALMDLD